MCIDHKHRKRVSEDNHLRLDTFLELAGDPTGSETSVVRWFRIS
jgi:hypothetical protein